MAKGHYQDLESPFLDGEVLPPPAPSEEWLRADEEYGEPDDAESQEDDAESDDYLESEQAVTESEQDGVEPEEDYASSAAEDEELADENAWGDATNAYAGEWRASDTEAVDGEEYPESYELPDVEELEEAADDAVTEEEKTVETFPSGETLPIVALTVPKGDEHYDPNNSGNPLLDTSGPHRRKMLSRNISVAELARSGGRQFDRARIDPNLVVMLQAIQDRVGKPIKITSGYRSFAYNIEVYRRRNQKPTQSRHSSGSGADIQIAGMTGIDIAKVAIDVYGVNMGVGIANSYAHVDARPAWAKWTYFGKNTPRNDQALREIQAYRDAKAKGGGRPPQPSTVPAAPPRDGGIASLPGRIAELVRRGMMTLQVALSMVAGERDSNELTNAIFFARHPERNRARIRPEETSLAAEWRDIRDRIVKPALEQLSALTPAAASPSSHDIAAGGATTVPVGPFGTLTIESPERLRLQYQFKPADVLWTARLVEGEAGGEDNTENVAVVWALVNRFAMFRKDLHDKTFADFIQRYSTTLQPYLRNPDAIRRAMETSRQNPTSPALRWVDLGGTFSYKGKEYPKGQYQKHLALQTKPWNQLRKGSRLVAERVLGGQVGSPIGIASDFDGTHIFLNRSLRKSGRNPSTIPSDEYRRLWVEFTLQHAKRKNRIWIGEHVPGLRQMKSNVFYIHPRTKDLPADTVRILPGRGH